MQSLRCRELCLSPYRSLRHTPAAPHATRHFVFEVVVCAGGSGVWGVGLAFGCCCALCLPLPRFSTIPQHRMPPTASFYEAAAWAGGSGV